MFPVLGMLDSYNDPTEPGPGFAFRNNGKNIEGVQVRVMATTGYQVGLVEAVFPFQGLYNHHLMAVDFALPDVHAHPGYVLPDVVTRHYGECQILCKTQNLVEYYREFFKDAVRVHVELQSENYAWVREHLDKKQRGELSYVGGMPEAPALRVSRDVLEGLAEMNLALYKADKQRMSTRYPVGF